MKILIPIEYSFKCPSRFSSKCSSRYLSKRSFDCSSKCSCQCLNKLDAENAVDESQFSLLLQLVRGHSFMTSAFFRPFWTPPSIPPVSKCQIFVDRPLSAYVRFLRTPPPKKTQNKIFQLVGKFMFFNP